MKLWICVALLCVAACSERRDQPSPEPIVQFERAASDAIAHGRRVASVLGCTGCHGADLTGEDWSEPGFGSLWTANLTRSAARYSDAQLADVIRGGARPDRDLWEMPSHLFTHLTRDDMGALIAFLRSRPPIGDERPEPVFGDGARREIAAGAFTSSRAQVRQKGRVWPPDAGEEYALGRYIVRATCAECHGLDLRGGRPNPQAQTRPDLRAAAAYQPDEFARLLRTGMAPGDRELGLMSEVARSRYKDLTEAEVDAIYRYLRRVAGIAP